jgi:hypothetical protein
MRLTGVVARVAYGETRNFSDVLHQCVRRDRKRDRKEENGPWGKVTTD